MIKKLTASTILLFMNIFLSSALANPPMLKNDPKRPVDKISQELGITEQQFINCFNDVNPAPQGSQPTKQRERMNKAVLLPCLQRANPDITNDRLDQVMDKYRR